MNRSEANARVAETRYDSITIAEHLSHQHGIRPELPSITDPGGMDEAVLRRLARRLGLDKWAPNDGTDIEDLRKQVIARQKSCGDGQCPGSAALLKAWGAAKKKIDAVYAQIDEDEPVGAPQTIQPRGLDVAAVVGAVGRVSS